MDDKIRSILEKPFAPELLKQRQGPGGKVFTYVEVGNYIARLNAAFLGDWSWEVTRRDQVDDQVVVEGRLTAGAVIKTGLGGAQVTRRRDDGRAVSIADDTKKAEADAIKRACRLLGIGGHLYASDDDVDVEPAPAAAHGTVPTPRSVGPTRSAGAPPPTVSRPPHDRSRLTTKQLNALLAISRSRGWDERKFKEHVRARYSVTLEYLTRAQASELIGTLSGNGHDERQPGEER